MSGTESDDRSFQTVFDHALEGVVVGCPDGTILTANPAARRIFGGTEAELQAAGRAGISVADHPAWQELLAERERVGRAVGVVPMVRLDGSPLLAEVSSAMFAEPGGEERICVIVRDVTERVRRERRLVAYDEITEALLANLDTAEVLGILSRHACNIFEADHAAVVVPRRDGPGTEILAAYGPGSELAVGRAYPPGGLPETVMTSGEPVLVEDVSSVTRDDEVRDLDLGPAMFAPLGSPDAIFGTVFIGGRPSRCPYDKADLEEATRYAARAGVIMAVGKARADAEDELRRTSEQLRQALDSRIVIEQAKGFVACHRHVTADEAFQMLRRYARSHNIGIHSVARQVLARTLFV